MTGLRIPAHARESKICGGNCGQHTAGQEGMEVVSLGNLCPHGGYFCIWQKDSGGISNTAKVSSLQRAYQAPPPGEE